MPGISTICNGFSYGHNIIKTFAYVDKLLVGQFVHFIRDKEKQLIDNDCWRHSSNGLLTAYAADKLPARVLAEKSGSNSPQS